MFVARHLRRLASSAAVLAALMAGQAHAETFAPVERNSLDITEGEISPFAPPATLRTTSPGMRAEVLDGGRHSDSARLSFSYLGESTTTVPLGSGLIRRDIGLKLRSANPCNLVYVMWHAFPDSAIQIQVKRNPGKTKSSQCGNGGYTTIATIPLGPGDATADHGTHELTARTSRVAGGALALAVEADGALLRQLTLPADLTAGLEGPVGVRSDNGDYVFGLATAAGSVSKPLAFGRGAGVTVKLAQRRIDARGRIAVRLANTNRFAVSGTLRGGAAAKRVRLGAGAKATVRLRLSKTARRVLNRRGKVALRLVAKLKDPAGGTRTVRQPVAVRR